MPEWIRLTPEGSVGNVESRCDSSGAFFTYDINDGYGVVTLTTPEALAFAAQLDEVRALVEVAQAVEWVQGDDPHNVDYDFCPWCKNWKIHGHTGDCQRQAALAPFKGLSDG